MSAWGRCGVHVKAMYWVKRKPKKDKRRMRRGKIRKEGSGEKQEKFCAGSRTIEIEEGNIRSVEN